jgi:D-psicose/D-tagatose/L-ribulose 3-epimerase
MAAEGRHMKVGINTWVWVSPFSTKDTVLIDKVKDMGFDSVEIAAEHWGPIDTRAVREAVRRSGLELTVGGTFGPDRDLISDDEDIRRGAFQYIEESIIRTAEMGGTIFSGPMYSAEGKIGIFTAERRKVFEDRFLQAMGKLMATAANYGVIVCLEPANRFETCFINTVDQAVAIVDLVDHPSFGILLDAFHMSIEESSFGSAVRRAGHRLKHFHACENHRGIPGAGLVRWDEIKNALLDIGYSGSLTIESFTPDIPQLAAAGYIWNPLANSQDQFAADGLSFLRNLF